MSALGGATVAWPFAARAQHTPIPVIGFLYVRSPEDSSAQVEAFRHGLAEHGYIEGQTVHIEYRWGRGQYDKMPVLAAELVSLPATLLVAGAEPSVLAVKAATSSIPIVFVVGTDPIKLGIVASFNRPGGNATGVDILTTSLEAKRLGLLQELIPRANTIGVLVNPKFPYANDQVGQIQTAADALGQHIQIFRASDPSEIDNAFDAIVSQRIAALTVAADPFFDTRRDQLVALASRHEVPVMYQFRQYSAAGGLMSYGIDLSDAYRQAGDYAGRILKGEKPADLPVLEPTKFELVINLRTAKMLGLSIPSGVLANADEVIE